ncbi:MAG: hypothetical protein R3228_15360, partial [Halioglobus sp.]|nr:hypothetical protein [Halioglobus sp.]
ELSARQYVNLTRILRELLTNALKHAQPQNLWITLAGTDELKVTFRHDGKIADPQEWSWGRGQYNLVTRAEEIGGEISFSASGEAQNRYLDVILSVPL